MTGHPRVPSVVRPSISEVANGGGTQGGAASSAAPAVDFAALGAAALRRMARLEALIPDGSGHDVPPSLADDLHEQLRRLADSLANTAIQYGFAAEAARSMEVDAASDAVPWELVDQAGLRHPVARRFTDLLSYAPIARSAYRVGNGPAHRRILIVVARRPDPPLAWLVDEAKRLAQKLAALPLFWQIDVWTPPDAPWAEVRADLRRALQDVDILHLCGHVAPTESMSETPTIWQFQLDGARGHELDPRGLRLFAFDEVPSLIVCNTCGHGASMDLARAALTAGVRAFVQPALPLLDRVGGGLAARLYEELAYGRTLGAAVVEVRRSLARRPSALWGAYRLYGDADWRG